MPDEGEMEILMEKLTDNFGHDIMKREGGNSNGEAESVSLLGALGERSRTGSVGSKDILED